MRIKLLTWNCDTMKEVATEMGGISICKLAGPGASYFNEYESETKWISGKEYPALSGPRAYHGTVPEGAAWVEISTDRPELGEFWALVNARKARGKR